MTFHPGDIDEGPAPDLRVITFETQDGRTLTTPPLSTYPDNTPRVVAFPPNYRGEWFEALMWAGVARHAPYMPSVLQRGLTPWCECGWHPELEGGRLLAEHIAEAIEDPETEAKGPTPDPHALPAGWMGGA